MLHFITSLPQPAFPALFTVLSIKAIKKQPGKNIFKERKKFANRRGVGERLFDCAEVISVWQGTRETKRKCFV
jgi:hypothetical protein